MDFKLYIVQLRKVKLQTVFTAAQNKLKEVVFEISVGRLLAGLFGYKGRKAKNYLTNFALSGMAMSGISVSGMVLSEMLVPVMETSDYVNHQRQACQD